MAANRPAARSSWARMRCLAATSSGVSGSEISSRRTGTSGAYLAASLRTRGPVTWISPAPLSVKSEALMTRAHGLRRRLSATCSRYCSSVSRSGAYSGLVARPVGDLRPELRGQHRERVLRPAARGQLRGVILHRVVQEGGDDHVGVVHTVVGHDPDRHSEQVIGVRLALPLVARVQLRREVKGLVQPAPVLPGPCLDLGREPGAQALLAVGRGNRVQRHGRHQPPLATVHALDQHTAPTSGTITHRKKKKRGGGGGGGGGGRGGSQNQTGEACGCWAGSRSSGRKMANRVMPGWLVTMMQPPCAATTASTRRRPRPVLFPAALASRARPVAAGEPLEQLGQQLGRGCRDRRR